MEYTRKTTKDHFEIKLWAENHHGKPQKIDHPDAKADPIGLRLDFPGGADEAYQVTNEAVEITWEEFFEIFDTQGLSFEYSMDMPKKDPSDLYRFLKA